VAIAKSTDIDPAPTVSRKADHIRINVEEDVQAKGITTGFERYRFVHAALPEVDLDDVDLGVELFGRRLGAPLFISCMTGGVPEAQRINLALAAVAQELGLAVGLGSARVLLEHPEVLPTFNVRGAAPAVFLMANLGAVQLNRGVRVDDCRRLVDMLKADALVLHLNPLQEALQPEGDTCFAGLLERIADLCRRLERPVIVKEVGWGIASDLVELLLEAGVSAVDVAGAGGTSWSEVERRRMADPVRQRVAAGFADWGISTSDALIQARRVAPDAPIFASGGIADGMDVAKALALGATMVGAAGPFLRAASKGEDAALELAQELLETLRLTMFCVGARTVAALARTPRLIGPGLRRPDGRTTTLTYLTTTRHQFIDITADVAEAVRRSGVRHGIVHICSFHTTAAIRVNENEPLLLCDFRRLLDRLAPLGVYEHDDMSRRVQVPPDEPLNGHAHCQHLLLSSSESLPICDGALMLGPWQSVFLVELDSPRTRRVTVQVVGDE
jgi:isopentenyl-diphosphate Delta-isomerase